MNFAGGASLLWYIVWLLVVRNKPQDDWCMSEDEKLYLKEKINYLTEDKVGTRYLLELIQNEIQHCFFEEIDDFC